MITQYIFEHKFFHQSLLNFRPENHQGIEHIIGMDKHNAEDNLKDLRFRYDFGIGKQA